MRVLVSSYRTFKAVDEESEGRVVAENTSFDGPEMDKSDSSALENAVKKRTKGCRQRS